jgi:hypothetical protein
VLIHKDPIQSVFVLGKHKFTSVLAILENL